MTKTQAKNTKTLADLPDKIKKAIEKEMRASNSLEQIGFEQDEFGQWHAKGCSVTLYPCCGEWEIDIVLPNFRGVRFDGQRALPAKRRSAAAEQ